MANHWFFSYSNSPKPEAQDGAMLLELDTGKVFRFHVGSGWQPWRRFQMEFVDLWQDLPMPPSGAWTPTDLAPWVHADATAVQIVAQTLRISPGPERQVTFGIRGRGETAERKGIAVVRTGAMVFRGNFIPLVVRLNAERAIELFRESDGPDASAIFTLSGYFVQRE